MKTNTMRFFKKINKKKTILILTILIIILFFGWLFLFKNNKNKILETGVVSKQNLTQTVLTTGQVVSGTVLDLSFQTSGVVKNIFIKEGDVVSVGQLLATLDQTTALANLKIAEGSLMQAKANYEKIVNGPTKEEIKILEDSVDSAKQDVNNGYAKALLYLDDAYIKIYNSLSSVVLLEKDYFNTNDQEGILVKENKNQINNNLNKFKNYFYKAKETKIKNDIDIALNNGYLILNEVADSLKIIRDVCDRGIYYSKVTSTDKSIIDSHRNYINTSLSNNVSSEQLILSYKISLTKAENQLLLKKTPARQEDVDLYKAQIVSAQGQVDSATSSLNNMILRAPTKGTITKIDAKIGQTINQGLKILVLQDIESLHVESDISEANISSLKIDQTIDYTFDALGPDKHFMGKILTIDPASTIISGVVNYKIKSSLENIPDIKPGMTTNMIIQVAQKENVLAIPYSAIINKNKKQYVRLITDKKNNAFIEKEIKTGLLSDDGLIEISFGLQENEEIVVYIK